MKKNSITSYAILGLLARRPWSAYELNVYFRNSHFAQIWPRAVSHLYQEPKKLVAKELAEVRYEKCNGRNRSVYSITNKGRESLLKWLNAHDGHYTVESESLLKFALSDTTDIHTLVNLVKGIEHGARSELTNISKRLDKSLEVVSHEQNSDLNLEIQLIRLTIVTLKARLNWVNQTLKYFENWSSPVGPKFQVEERREKLIELKQDVERILNESVELDGFE